MLQILQHAAPLFGVLVFSTMFTAWLRRERVSYLAITQARLLKAGDPEESDTLDYLFAWTDLMSATSTGVFVFTFVSLGKAVSASSSSVRLVELGGALILSPLMIVVVSLLSRRLGLTIYQSKPIYWLLYAVLVVPSYVVALVIDLNG